MTQVLYKLGRNSFQIEKQDGPLGWKHMMKSISIYVQ